MSSGDEQPSDILPPGTVLGRYEIRRLIGQGGMGSVYEGVHRDLKKRVAIKTLLPGLAANPEARQRFFREGEAASRIRHPHVVDVTDVGAEGPITYLVMEYLHGEDLGGLLGREGGLSVERTGDLMLPVMAAIAVAHEQGVVHRDLKPENIFLATSGYGGVVPKVLDFGISKVLDEVHRMALTGTAVTLGTAYYLPPEQLRGSRQADARGDQYALGAILYECLTGRRAFEAESLYAVLKAVGDGTYAPLTDQRRDVPAALDAAINRAMSLNPADRFDTVRHLGFALAPFASPAVRTLWQPFFDVAAPGMSTAPLGAPSRQAPVPTPAQVVPRVVTTRPIAGRSLNTLDGASGEPSTAELRSTLSVPRRKLPLLAALAAVAVVAVVVAAMRREQPRHHETTAATVTAPPVVPAAPPVAPPPAAKVEPTAPSAPAAAANEPAPVLAGGAPDAATAPEAEPVVEKAAPAPARHDRADRPAGTTTPATSSRPRRPKAEAPAGADSGSKAPRPKIDAPAARPPNKAPIVE